MYNFGYLLIISLILCYIVVMGGWQLYQTKVKGELNKKSFVSLGAVAVIVGVIAYIHMIKDAF